MQPPLSQRVSACLGLLTAAALLCPVAGARSAPHGQETPRYVTDRPNAIDLPLPGEEDAFTFAIFGDRTGGPAEGIEVLRDAVRDVNLFEPDLVMTVGDLIQGYNQTPEWMLQMHEFRDVMGGLAMPWFPVAGNHDIYWRGEDRPEGEHEASYERHFGPLWYAFEHKDSWFVVLYTDEGNPETGVKDFHVPDAQRISPEQFAWLEQTLEQTGEANHVFVFLHHPRWRGGQYGDDWERVHRLLASRGNVTACFAGHIHRMIYSGERDGIEYFALATTGGVLEHRVPEAGFLHHYHLVTVRPGRISLATLPVGAAIDPRKVTEEVSDAAVAIDDRLRPRFETHLSVENGRALDEDLRFWFENPIQRPLELELSFESRDSRWIVDPDHLHTKLAPGERKELSVHVRRRAGSLDEALHLPEMLVACDVLAEGLRFRMPDRRVTVPVRAIGLTTRRDNVLELDGRNGHLRVESDMVSLPEGPFTIEARMRARSFRPRQAVLSKTESGEYGLYVGDGRPAFAVHLDGRYVRASVSETALDVDRWYHVAGVFDGSELRLYLDGALIARRAATGPRRTHALPLLIGADPNREGHATSLFDGYLDEVRVSSVARYAGERFEPETRHQADEATLLLLHMEGGIGPWSVDSSASGAHPLRSDGAAEVDALEAR